MFSNLPRATLDGKSTYKKKKKKKKKTKRKQLKKPEKNYLWNRIMLGSFRIDSGQCMDWLSECDYDATRLNYDILYLREDEMFDYVLLFYQ